MKQIIGSKKEKEKKREKWSRKRWKKRDNKEGDLVEMMIWYDTYLMLTWSDERFSDTSGRHVFAIHSYTQVCLAPCPKGLKYPCCYVHCLERYCIHPRKLKESVAPAKATSTCIFYSSDKKKGDLKLKRLVSEKLSTTFHIIWIRYLLATKK